MSKHAVLSESEGVIITIPDASEPIKAEEKAAPAPIHYDASEPIEEEEKVAPDRHYKALVTLWHSVEARHVYPGEPIDLSHFDAATLADFIERGYVKRTRR